ncbi:hypothetical protein HK101_007857, partial [Irineochytrium annulatum]
MQQHTFLIQQLQDLQGGQQGVSMHPQMNYTLPATAVPVAAIDEDDASPPPAAAPVVAEKTTAEMLKQAGVVNGGLTDPQSLSKYLKALKGATEVKDRWMVLNVLKSANTSKEFLHEFVQNDAKGLAYLRVWLSDAKDSERSLTEGVLSSLKILPIGLEALKASKIGKVVKNLTKDDKGGNIKNLAVDLHEAWVRLLNAPASAPKRTLDDDASKSGGDAKRGKAADGKPQPARKPAEEKKPLMAQDNMDLFSDLKSDSAPLQFKKRDLPTARKATSASAASSTAATRAKAPSASHLRPASPVKPRSPSPPRTPVNPDADPEPQIVSYRRAAQENAAEEVAGLSDVGRKKGGGILKKDDGRKRPKRNIRFAIGAELEKIRYFSVDQVDEGPSSGTSARESEGHEGHNLSHLRELVANTTWETPKRLFTPAPDRGKESNEVHVQRHRELTVMSATFMNEPSPAEPDFNSDGDQVTTRMIPMYELSEDSPMQEQPPAAPVSTGPDVAAILALLAAGNPAPAAPVAPVIPALPQFGGAGSIL